MRISSKGRYGLASMIFIAKQYDAVQCSTVLSIAEKLGISKIYLEQVFALLKRAGLVTSVKGAQGGYQLSSPPINISALDILSAVELSLFEETDSSVAAMAGNIESVMTCVWKSVDSAVKDTLSGITLQQLAAESKQLDSDGSDMFYI